MKTYEVLFNKECDTYYTKNPEYNMMFLRHTEVLFNDLLRKRGYIFLRDIIEGMGIKPTRDMLLAGWVWKEQCQYIRQIEFEVFAQENGIKIIFLNVEDNISYAFEEGES